MKPECRKSRDGLSSTVLSTIATLFSATATVQALKYKFVRVWRDSGYYIISRLFGVMFAYIYIHTCPRELFSIYIQYTGLRKSSFILTINILKLL